MTLQSFINNMSSDETHSNEYAKGSVSRRTYSQRVRSGEKRNMIGAYRQSSLGQAYVEPGMRRSGHDQSSSRNISKNSGLDHRSRQDMNARGGVSGGTAQNAPMPPRQTFREPQSRSYNPYS